MVMPKVLFKCMYDSLVFNRLEVLSATLLWPSGCLTTFNKSGEEEEEANPNFRLSEWDVDMIFFTDSTAS